MLKRIKDCISIGLYSAATVACVVLAMHLINMDRAAKQTNALMKQTEVVKQLITDLQAINDDKVDEVLRKYLVPQK